MPLARRCYSFCGAEITNRKCVHASLRGSISTTGKAGNRDDNHGTGCGRRRRRGGGGATRGRRLREAAAADGLEREDNVRVERTSPTRQGCRPRDLPPLLFQPASRRSSPAEPRNGGQGRAAVAARTPRPKSDAVVERSWSSTPIGSPIPRACLVTPDPRFGDAFSAPRQRIEDPPHRSV